MTESDDFWDDLLAHLRAKVLVPITGPGLNIVTTGDTEYTLTEIIAQRLNDRYRLDLPRTRMTMGEAVAACLRQRGRDEFERLYRVISDIILEFDEQPCAPLRALAEISDLSLFISTTPDRLLARAINEVRFHGRDGARELTFSPNQSTGQQARNLQDPADAETSVVRLFGQAASTPQYAIHDEDLLEWLHSLLSGGGCLPPGIMHALKHQPLLFIGCDVPDWLDLFLLRLSSQTRLSEGNKQFFFVHSSTAREPVLKNFFSTYCRRAQVQQLEMAPHEFVSELHGRWHAARRPADPNRRPGHAEASTAPAENNPTIFISYIHEDIDYARRLHAEISDLGGDVWLDERRLRPGDTWENEVLHSIRKQVRLFLPIISACTEREEEGYVFREWREAVNRSYSIPSRRFIIPIVVDQRQGDFSAYRQIPDEFRQLNFGYAPTGAPDSSLRSLLIEEIREIRRRVTP